MITLVSIGSNDSINKIKIYYEPYYLAIYNKYPSLAYAIMTHELRHVDDAVNKQDLFVISTKNSKEKFLFELDALVIEAYFVREVASRNKYQLTGFEKYLLAVSEPGQEYQLALTFLGTDYVTFNRINEFYDFPTFDSAYNAFLALGDSLLNAFKVDSTNSEWEQYISIMPLFTYEKFLKQNAFDMFSKFKKAKEPASFHIEDYPELVRLSSALDNRLSPYQDLLNFQSRFIESIDKSLNIK
jgi:hypothetical protein